MSPLTKFTRALELFTALDPDMQLSAVQVYLTIAARPGLTQKDLERATDSTRSSSSRHVQYLSTQHWKKGPDGKFLPGLDLVVAVTNPFDSRSKVVSLTAKGRRLNERLAATLD